MSMSAPAASTFDPKLTAWARLSRAPTSAATCKYALCAVDAGKGAGKIAKGSLILTPINTHCGGKMGAYHGACFFLAQDAPAAATAAGSDSAAAAADGDASATRWCHLSPFTNCRFALVQQHPADGGNVKTADAAARCTTPLRRVEDLLGWAALSADEQAEMRAASQAPGTGAGTKMKGGKRKFEPSSAAAAAAATTGPDASDAAAEECDSKSPRGSAKRGSVSTKKKVAVASTTSSLAKRSKQPEAAPKTAADTSELSPTSAKRSRSRR